MNPGQNYTEGDSMARCGVGKDNYSTTLILWYLPPTVPHEETKNYETWRKQATRMSILTGTNVWTNAVISLQVKPGYYHIAHETYECTARGVIWINKSGQESSDITTFEFDTSVIPIGITNKGRTSYCAKVTHNSNMPGGPDGGEDVRMKESYSCPVAGKGYNIMLNTSCGGLNGADDLQLWHELFTPDDESGENKLPGLGAYEKIFGRKFVLPNEDSTSCDDLFPNTIREVGCDEVSNSDIGSVAQFGANVDAEFGMEYWNGSTVQFRPPSQEIWSAIQAASAKHGCDPLLVLAVAHSESSGYRNDTVSSADARGVWQFTPGTWDTWRIPYVASADNCNKHQPATFSTEGLDFSSPTNIVAAADSACRKIMWIGMQRYPNDVNSFERVFAINGDNPYSQIWNAHTAQGNYVWRLWGELRSRLSTQALPHPANYPLPGWESCSARRN